MCNSQVLEAKSVIICRETNTEQCNRVTGSLTHSKHAPIHCLFWPDSCARHNTPILRAFLQTNLIGPLPWTGSCIYSRGATARRHLREPRHVGLMWPFCCVLCTGPWGTRVISDGKLEGLVLCPGLAAQYIRLSVCPLHSLGLHTIQFGMHVGIGLYIYQVGMYSSA